MAEETREVGGVLWYLKQWQYGIEQDNNKLVLCGPHYLWTWSLTGKYNPENWPRFRGNAAQRRVLVRLYTRRWNLVQSVQKKYL